MRQSPDNSPHPQCHTRAQRTDPDLAPQTGFAEPTGSQSSAEKAASGVRTPADTAVCEATIARICPVTERTNDARTASAQATARRDVTPHATVRSGHGASSAQSAGERASEGRRPLTVIENETPRTERPRKDRSGRATSQAEPLRLGGAPGTAQPSLGFPSGSPLASSSRLSLVSSSGLSLAGPYGLPLAPSPDRLSPEASAPPLDPVPDLPSRQAPYIPPARSPDPQPASPDAPPADPDGPTAPLPGVPLGQDWPVTLASIPAEDPEVYDMICRADTLGVFQIESRAQMTMLPRLRPRTFYDLVIEVAIVRPGPIQGDMVHPYLRRRQGKERVTYPSQELKTVLAKTLGVPLFQEQAMKIAIVAAGFTPAEADQLRRAMATFKKVGTIGTFQQKMVDGMTAKGYDPEFAARCFQQIEGFGEYGFPESHAASFALLVYSSCWLKCHYPDVFCAALLNSQPMGFYAPAQIVRDARQHGVEVRPVDINRSDWDCTLEEGPRAAERLHADHASMRTAIRSRCAVRLGLRQIKGLAEADMRLLVARRGRGYDTVRDLWLRTGLTRAAVERLAEADAFGSLGLNRRDALWAARGLDRDARLEDLPLFAASDLAELQKEVAANLPPMPPGEEVINDYRFLSLSLKAHPAAFVRGALRAERVVPARAVPGQAGRRVSVAGLVLVRQRPGSAKGVIFMTVEDETGVANVIVWPKVFEAFRSVVLGARFIKVSGWVQAEDNVVHVVATKLEDRTALLSRLTDDVGDWDALDRADEVKRPGTDPRTDSRPRTLLAQFVTEVGAVSREAAGLGDSRTVAEALEAHRKAAAAIARGGKPPEPARRGPSERWNAQADGAVAGSRHGSAAGNSRRATPDQELPPEVRKALPKGRNFQ